MVDLTFSAVTTISVRPPSLVAAGLGPPRAPGAGIRLRSWREMERRYQTRCAQDDGARHATRPRMSAGMNGTRARRHGRRISDCRSHEAPPPLRWMKGYATQQI